MIVGFLSPQSAVRVARVAVLFLGVALVVGCAREEIAREDLIIVDGLKNEDPEVRHQFSRRAAHGSVTTEEMIEPLFTGLKDADPRIRANCARALGKVEPHKKGEVFNRMIEAQQSETNNDVKYAYSDALAHLQRNN